MSYPDDNREPDLSEIDAYLDEMHPVAGGHVQGHNQIENDLRALRTAVDTAKADIAAIEAAIESISTPELEDDSVTAAKIDWASTGANGGIWWEELGRTTLSVAGDTVSVTGISARKYLQIRLCMLSSGSIDVSLRFNNDSTNSYVVRKSDNGGADSTATSLPRVDLVTGVFSAPLFGIIDVINIAANEKMFIGHTVQQGTAGAGNAPTRKEFADKWTNTSSYINRVDIINISTGDFAIGSEVVVLGHD